MTIFRGFPPASLTFLRGLKKNNRRDWFEERRETYLRDIVGPLKALVEELDVRFASLAPEFVGDPKTSLFRIYRDVRFSKDKSPYKAHAAAWIFHRAPGRGVGHRVGQGRIHFAVQAGDGRGRCSFGRRHAEPCAGFVTRHGVPGTPGEDKR